MNKTGIVVPCFNEAVRFPAVALQEFEQAFQSHPIRFIFVDDGSTDETRALLQALVDRSGGRAELLGLDKNVGKAEAVRAGLRRAIDDGAEVVGYLDADLATSITDLAKLLRVLADSSIQTVLGSRVQLLGKKIERKLWRHYLGRCFATLASLVLRIPVYDTQCGAKVFRVSETLKSVLSEPFLTRWAFDIEILGRGLAGYPGVGRWEIRELHENPLDRWVDRSGSKLSLFAMIRTAGELALIESDLRLRRKKYARAEHRH